MAKPIPIKLPNGRNWSKKGAAVEHFKDMLNRYKVGDRVLEASDHSDLASLLEVYDSACGTEEKTKIGNGIGFFEKRLDLDHPGNTACFFVVRIDGSSIDFSTRRALDVASTLSR